MKKNPTLTILLIAILLLVSQGTIAGSQAQIAKAPLIASAADYSFGLALAEAQVSAANASTLKPSALGTFIPKASAESSAPQAEHSVLESDKASIEYVVNLLSATRRGFNLITGDAGQFEMHCSVLSALLLSRKYESYGNYPQNDYGFSDYYTLEAYNEIITGVFGQAKDTFPWLIANGVFGFGASGYIGDGVAIDSVNVDSEGYYHAYGVIMYAYSEDGEVNVEKPYYHAILQKSDDAMFGFFLLAQEMSEHPFRAASNISAVDEIVNGNTHGMSDIQMVETLANLLSCARDNFDLRLTAQASNVAVALTSALTSIEGFSVISDDDYYSYPLGCIGYFSDDEVAAVAKQYFDIDPSYYVNELYDGHVWQSECIRMFTQVVIHELLPLQGDEYLAKGIISARYNETMDVDETGLTEPYQAIVRKGYGSLGYVMVAQSVNGAALSAAPDTATYPATAASTLAAEIASTDIDWKRLYREFLLEYTTIEEAQDAEDEANRYIFAIALRDYDEDGVPELVTLSEGYLDCGRGITLTAEDLGVGNTQILSFTPVEDVKTVRIRILDYYWGSDKSSRNYQANYIAISELRLISAAQ